MNSESTICSIKEAHADLRGKLIDIEPLGLKSSLTIRNEEAEFRMVADVNVAHALSVSDTLGVDVATDRLVAFDAITGRGL